MKGEVPVFPPPAVEADFTAARVYLPSAAARTASPPSPKDSDAIEADSTAQPDVGTALALSRPTLPPPFPNRRQRCSRPSPTGASSSRRHRPFARRPWRRETKVVRWPTVAASPLRALLLAEPPPPLLLAEPPPSLLLVELLCHTLKFSSQA
uniref:Uncharacterized protein n=1 Tax=Oryza sativa subsp. japonica TaxID=39947 RepID=Q6ZCG2_ORYSJ|nr:hypothetical protein [Oryza sativa Japonica Group]